MHLIDATICNRKLHDLLMKCYSQPYTPNHYRINKTNPTKWNTTATFCCISCSFEPNFSAYISFICADLRAPKTLEILFCWLFPVTLRNVGSSWNGKHILNYFSFVENKLHYSAFATRNICFFFGCNRISPPHSLHSVGCKLKELLLLLGRTFILRNVSFGCIVSYFTTNVFSFSCYLPFQMNFEAKSRARTTLYN